jgi:hypothetical protein
MANSQDIDYALADEVVRFAKNSPRSYEALMNIYLERLKKKRVKGTYTKQQSYTLLKNLYSNYVRPEMKAKKGVDPKLYPAEREYFARQIGDYLWDEFLKKVKPASQKTSPRAPKRRRR